MRPNDKRFLSKQLLKLMAVTAPPVAIDHVDHDLDDNDVVSMRSLAAMPAAARRGAVVRCQAAEECREISFNSFEECSVKWVSIVIRHRKKKLDELHLIDLSTPLAHDRHVAALATFRTAMLPRR